MIHRSYDPTKDKDAVRRIWREAGFRHAGISTDWDNYRAQLFYTNFGYQFLDRTFGFSKRLQQEARR